MQPTIICDWYYKTQLTLVQCRTIVDQWFGCQHWLNSPLNGKIHEVQLFFLFTLVKLSLQIFASTPYTCLSVSNLLKKTQNTQ